MKRIPIKQPLEEWPEIVDFAAFLETGETITYRNADSKVAKGDASDAATVVKSTLISASTVKVIFQRGTHGIFYQTRVLISTSGNNVWHEDLVMPVWDLFK